ncbi:MAG: hypothetical protein HYS55_01990, partial [Candidatus Omnitrophica bacterium]|nr:hypothetical protein [Candidatus Omnitrophota bacterium]
MKRFWLLLFMLMPALAAMGDEPLVHVVVPMSGPEQAFRYELSQVARKAIELGHARFSVVKPINDSFQRAAQAVIILIEERDFEKAASLLREAVKKFSGNRLAYLLL